MGYGLIMRTGGGIDTSTLTATESDVAEGKTAYTKNGLSTGTGEMIRTIEQVEDKTLDVYIDEFSGKYSFDISFAGANIPYYRCWTMEVSMTTSFVASNGKTITGNVMCQYILYDNDSSLQSIYWASGTNSCGYKLTVSRDADNLTFRIYNASEKIHLTDCIVYLNRGY